MLYAVTPDRRPGLMSNVSDHILEGQWVCCMADHPFWTIDSRNVLSGVNFPRAPVALESIP